MGPLEVTKWNSAITMGVVPKQHDAFYVDKRQRAVESIISHPTDPTCEVPRTITGLLCNQSFSIAALHLPRIPLHLCDSQLIRDSQLILLELRRLLKIHLYCRGQRRLATLLLERLKTWLHAK